MKNRKKLAIVAKMNDKIVMIFDLMQQLRNSMLTLT